MKKQVLLLFVILLSGCGMFKDVAKQQSSEKVKITEFTAQWKRQQGEIIILPYPRTPNKIYRDTIIEYVTDKGSKVSTSYDDKGEIDNQVVICPDSEETKQTDLKASYSLQEKEVERKMNIDTVNAVGKWLAIILIPGQLFFAAAWWLRGKK